MMRVVTASRTRLPLWTARTWLSERLTVGLGAKMGVLVVIGTLSIIGLFAYLGTAALNESTQRVLQARVVLAQTTASHIDYVLADIEQVLSDTAAQNTWGDPEQVAGAMDRAYHRLSFYSDRIFFVDKAGTVIDARPPTTSSLSLQQFSSVMSVLEGRTFAVSRFTRSLGTAGFSTVAAAPVANADGEQVGALVATIALTGPSIRTFTNPIGLRDTGYMDLVDLGGVILTSTRPERIGQPSDHGDSLAELIRDHRQAVSACHDCHTPTSTPQPRAEVLAFAPLERAQWGVTIREGEDEAFGAIRQLQVRIFVLMLVMLAGALVLVYLTTRSVIVPVQALTAATNRIAAGDWTTPIPARGGDEIGALALSFETMRGRLKNSLSEIQAWNRELDARVEASTAAYRAATEQKEQLKSELLHRVIAAQEDERKRISRELHDETCQLLTGLSFLLEDAAQATSLSEIQPLLKRTLTLTKDTLNGVHRIIFDLRPTMLDRLGLIPALRWYAGSRIGSAGIQFAFREIGISRRLSPPCETAIFRVVQEAINNIALHSHARHAGFVFDFRDHQVRIEVTDDGVGFDPASLAGTREAKRGLGLMGMEERVTAIGGEFHLHSLPGRGTAIHLIVPMDEPAPPSKQEESEHG